MGINDLLLSGSLTERDIAIVQSVWRLGLLSSRQIERLHFPAITFNNLKTSRRIAQRRLKKLSDWGLLARKMTSPFKPHLYVLDREGAQLIKTIQGVDELAKVWTPTDVTEVLLTKAHRDEVAEFVITLTEVLRQLHIPIDWQGERESLITFPDHTYFWPDGIATLFPSNAVMHFFLEWDRSTETMRRIWDKARNYLKYYSYENNWNLDYERFPPVVFVTTGGHRRRDNMVHEIARQMQDTHTHPADFVALVGCQADLTHHGILADVFVRAGAPDAPPISLLGSAKAKLVPQEGICIPHR